MYTLSLVCLPAHFCASQDEAVRSYVKTDATLTEWQAGMSALYKQIVDTTPVGEISDSSMEFKFDGDSRRYMKSESSSALSEQNLSSQLSEPWNVLQTRAGPLFLRNCTHQKDALLFLMLVNTHGPRGLNT